MPALRRVLLLDESVGVWLARTGAELDAWLVVAAVDYVRRELEVRARAS
jgi:hypothetical protein